MAILGSLLQAGVYYKIFQTLLRDKRQVTLPSTLKKTKNMMRDGWPYLLLRIYTVGMSGLLLVIIFILLP
jgi:hypothetical protein